MNKAGSTALQTYAFHNRATLSAAGLEYLRHPFANHSWLLSVLFRNRPIHADAEPVARLHSSNREGLTRAVEAELAEHASAGRDMLISAETAFWFTAREVAALAAFVRPHYERVVILAMIRSPYGFVRSNAQQRVRTGGVLAELVQRPTYPLYRPNLQRYIDVFGRDAVRLLHFDPKAFPHGDVLQGFLSMLDGDYSSLAGERAPRVNTGSSLTAVKLLDLLNASLRQRALVPAIPEPVQRVLLEGYLGSYLRHAFAAAEPQAAPPPPVRLHLLDIPGPAFVLPASMVNRLRDVGEADDAWVSALLGVNVRDYPAPEATPPFTLEDYQRFEPDEVEAIVAALQRANEGLTEPYDGSARKLEAAAVRSMQTHLEAYGARVPAGAS